MHCRPNQMTVLTYSKSFLHNTVLVMMWWWTPQNCTMMLWYFYRQSCSMGQASRRLTSLNLPQHVGWGLFSCDVSWRSLFGILANSSIHTMQLMSVPQKPASCMAGDSATITHSAIPYRAHLKPQTTLNPWQGGGSLSHIGATTVGTGGDWSPTFRLGDQQCIGWFPNFPPTSWP